MNIFEKIALAIKNAFQPAKKLPVATPTVPTSGLPWLDIAIAEIGVHELPGKLHQKRILEYHATTTLKATIDEVPWCSSFINWCFAKLGWRHTKSASAASWLTWGTALTEPRLGCVVVFSREGGNHVAFFIKREGDKLVCLGGNQSDSVCEASYDISRVRGYRWPVEASSMLQDAMLGGDKLPWEGRHPDSAKWTADLLRIIGASKLPTLVPKDIHNYVPQYASFSTTKRILVWAHLLAIMAKYESSWRPECSYTESFADAKGNKVVSRGLLQLSIESANGYGCGLKEAAQLHDAKTNLFCAVRILETWIERDNVVFGHEGGKWLGSGRYWSCCRSEKNGGPRASYIGITEHLRKLRL